MNNNKSISDLIIEYFKKHPNKDLPHGPVVDWVEEEYKKNIWKKTKGYLEIYKKITSRRIFN